ncbi:hypothetical protein NHX12_034493 [Muraenolepis orangiensis]|uniref:Uncharacterized protein n=1 Tax=Muraenolepis orangiensis TaxID=630683 RepID=A0A9Q0I2Y7_9TELE|nr:hypothetical protein NHX12_034493 [Muraenolepis orangiensis]
MVLQDGSRVTETSEEHRPEAEVEAAVTATMASNSLFSTVTPCQQNFFWGEHYREPLRSPASPGPLHWGCGWLAGDGIGICG